MLGLSCSREASLSNVNCSLSLENSCPFRLTSTVAFPFACLVVTQLKRLDECHDALTTDTPIRHISFGALAVKCLPNTVSTVPPASGPALGSNLVTCASGM